MYKQEGRKIKEEGQGDLIYNSDGSVFNSVTVGGGSTFVTGLNYSLTGLGNR